jgi:hypothetical protein
MRWGLDMLVSFILSTHVHLTTIYSCIRRNLILWNVERNPNLCVTIRLVYSGQIPHITLMNVQLYGTGRTTVPTARLGTGRLKLVTATGVPREADGPFSSKCVPMDNLRMKNYAERFLDSIIKNICF